MTVFEFVNKATQRSRWTHNYLRCPLSGRNSITKWRFNFISTLPLLFFMSVGGASCDAGPESAKFYRLQLRHRLQQNDWLQLRPRLRLRSPASSLIPLSYIERRRTVAGSEGALRSLYSLAPVGGSFWSFFALKGHFLTLKCQFTSKTAELHDFSRALLPQSQGRRHELLTGRGGGADSVPSNAPTTNSVFSSDFDHFILKILKNVKLLTSSLKKKISVKIAISGWRPPQTFEPGDESPSPPPCRVGAHARSAYSNPGANPGSTTDVESAAVLICHLGFPKSWFFRLFF